MSLAGTLQDIVTGYEPTNQMLAIEDLLVQQSHTPWEILRLVILLSLSIGGIRQKVLENFKREFLQIYGYHFLTTFIHLERLGLLHNAPAPAGNNFVQTRKQFRLWVEEADEQDPNDIAYVYSGFAPLSVRLVQCVSMKPAVMSTASSGERNQKDRPVREASAGIPAVPRAHPLMGWKGFEDGLESISGAVLDETQVREETPGPKGEPLPRIFSNRLVTDASRTCMEKATGMER
jgi:hypothetical protein